MKGLLRNLWLGMLAIAAVAMTSCSDTQEEPPTPAPKPEIKISNVTATASSVTFTLAATNSTDYAYAVTLKGATPGDMTPVTGKATSTETITDLQADKEYVITAVAYNADKTVKSETATHSVTTNPMAKLELGENVIVGASSAKITLIPTNAKEISYVCYEENKRPADVEWIVIETNEQVTVTVSDLTPATSYVFEAFASNDEGDSEIVKSKPFKTKDNFSVTLAATVDVAAGYVEVSDAVAGYLVLDFMFIAEQAPKDEEILEIFKEGLDSPWGAMPIYNESKWFKWSVGAPSTEYYAYTIEVDADKKLIESSLKKWSVSTAAENKIGTGSATAEIVKHEAFERKFVNEIKFSDNTVMFFTSCFSNDQMEAAGYTSVDKYVSDNLQMFAGGMSVLEDSPNDESIRVLENGNIQNTTLWLNPDVKYWYVVCAIDEQGKLSKLIYKYYATQPIPEDATVTASAEVVELGFVNAEFKVTITGADKVRGKIIRFGEFMDEYGTYKGNEKLMLAELAGEYASPLVLGANGEYAEKGLKPGDRYYFFLLPEKADGTFGKMTKVSFDTKKYNVEGVSTVAYEIGDFETNGKAPNWETYINATTKPGAGCAKYLVAWIQEWQYSADQETLINNALSSEGVIEYTGDQEIRREPANGGYYMIILPCDTDGKWAAPVVSQLIITPPTGGGGGGVVRR